MAAFTALALGAAASTIGTLSSISGQRKAAKAQQQQQALATQRSRRQAIRQAQLQRAQATATAQGQGSLGSSGAIGGIGALGSQLGEQFGFSTQMSGLSANIASGQKQASFGQGLAQLGAFGVNYGMSQGATFGGLFPPKPKINGGGGK